MPLWTKDLPPKFKTNAVATAKGWEDPATGEVLVAIRQLATKAGAGDVDAVNFAATSYAQGAALGVKVRFNEKVNVTAGANLVVTSNQTAGNYTLYAAAQSNVQEVLFNKQNDNTTNQTVAASVAATGTITGDGTNITDGDTVTIGAKTYTFQDTLTNVDGNVKKAGTAAGSLTNLFHAINASGGVVGTDYATATTAHPTVTATNPTGTTVVVTAITPGTGGNSLALSENSTHLSVSGANLAGGVTNTGTLSIGSQTITGTITDANSAIAAIGTLTFTQQPANDETVTIDSKVYTFKTTLTNTDGFVKIGTDLSGSIANLVSAINLGAGSGTRYAAATTLHSTVSAIQVGTTQVKVTAKTAGTGGNSLGSTTDVTGATWGGATLAGGVAAVATTKTISAGKGTAAGTRVIA